MANATCETIEVEMMSCRRLQSYQSFECERESSPDLGCELSLSEDLLPLDSSNAGQSPNSPSLPDGGDFMEISGSHVTTAGTHFPSVDDIVNKFEARKLS
jgi:hypothetical protein